MQTLTIAIALFLLVSSVVYALERRDMDGQEVTSLEWIVFILLLVRTLLISNFCNEILVTVCGDKET